MSDSRAQSRPFTAIVDPSATTSAPTDRKSGEVTRTFPCESKRISAGNSLMPSLFDISYGTLKVWFDSETNSSNSTPIKTIFAECLFSNLLPKPRERFPHRVSTIKILEDRTPRITVSEELIYHSVPTPPRSARASDCSSVRGHSCNHFSLVNVMAWEEPWLHRDIGANALDSSSLLVGSTFEI